MQEYPKAVSQRDFTENQNMNRYRLRVSFFESAQVGPDDILMVGDSITEHCEFAEMTGNLRVKNRGIGGDTVAGLLNRIGNVTAGAPAAIVINIGINDFQPENNNPNELLLADFESIVKHVRGTCPQTALVCSSILPVNAADFDRGADNSEIREYNDGIKSLCERYGAVFIDMFNEFYDPAGDVLPRRYTTDGIHLGGEGYEKYVGILDRELGRVGVDFVLR